MPTYLRRGLIVIAAPGDVVASVGELHLWFWKFVSAVRLQHLLLMLELTRPGGAAVLVNEVLSTDSCPSLLTVGDAGLGSLLQQEISARNFFTGTNPAELNHLLRSEPRLSSQLARVEFTAPWLWPFFTRTYAVYGVVLRK